MLQFIACTGIILVSGTYLSKYGDISAEKTAGPLLAPVSRNHLVTSLSIIIALAVAVIGLIYRADKKPLFFAWDSLAILAIYVFTLYFLYTMR
jgi:hypothetical protein